MLTEFMSTTFAICLSLLVGDIQHTQPSPRSLEDLSGKTGWVVIGDLTKDQKGWSVAEDPRSPCKSGSFEIVGRVVDRCKPILPKVGEQIRLTVDHRVFILDYQSIGEEHAMKSPESVERGLAPTDETGIVLHAGSVVWVREIVIAQPRGNYRIVWARVSSSS